MNERAPILFPGLALGLTVLVVVATGLEGRAEDTSRRPAPDAVAAQVDAFVLARLAEEKITPAPATTDEAFLRRVTLDLTGTVPTAAETVAFAADRARDKRTRQIDAILSSDAFVDHWTHWWHRTLTGLSGLAVAGRPGQGQGQGARYLAGDPGEAFRKWLHDQVATDRPYDEMVRELITATGRSDENGAAGFYVRWEGDPQNLAGATAKVFLGLRIQCAQCHDHPYQSEWLQDDFKGMAAFYGASFPRRIPYDQEMTPRGQRFVVDVTDFDPALLSRTRRRRAGGALPQGLRVRNELASVQPRLWQDAAVPDLPGISRRLLLARWVTADENPYFAQAFVNRVWGHLMGRGLVDPIDDFSPFNTPSHPEILALLADDFRDGGYDVRRLLRTLTATEAYQRSSSWADRSREAPDPSLYAKGAVRPLDTEQVYFSLLRASGVDALIDRGARQRGRRDQRLAFSAFSFVYDDDEAAEDQSFQGSVPLGLFLMNNRILQGAVSARLPGGTLGRVLREHRRDGDRIEALYLAAYGREPSSRETTRAARFVKQAGGDDAAWEDLFWALLNSAEFMTNH